MVSIIVPMYNGEKTIKQCVNSLINQKYSNIEIIIVDDGSVDKSYSICKELQKADNRIFLFRKKNEGVSSARNYGLKQIKGEYFLCVDCDDYVEPDYVLKMIEARDRYPRIGHIWCGFQTVNDYNKNGKCVYNIDNNKEFTLTSREKIMELHSLWLDNSPCNKLYSTKIIKENNLLMDAEKNLGEDMLFNYAYLDLERETSILVINKPLYNYVISNTESLDHKYISNIKEILIDNNNKVCKYISKWKVNCSQFELFFNEEFYTYEKILRNTMKKENKKSMIRKIIYNNEIIKSKEFKDVYSKFSGYMHPLYRKAYESEKYEFILILDFIVSIKNYLTLYQHKKGA